MKIAVIGGGSAGYFSALYLQKKYPEYQITLIESSKIPIIGVGEATTPILLKFLHHDLGFEASEFYKEVQPTLKTAVRFIWGQPNHDFINGFGPTNAVQTVFEYGETSNATINSVLLKENKTPFLKQGDKIVPIKIPNVFAYHLDNKRLVTFLKKKFTERNIGYWDCEIADFYQNPNTGNIETVISKEGEQKNFDYFFDCSGFKSILIKEKLQSKFINFDKSLFTNSAIVGKRENGGNPAPYTTAKTLNHGWLWNTPIREEDHLGYVFSDQFCTADQAKEEMRQFCNVDDFKLIKFTSGRHENSWVKNVVGIGNAFAFIEPLESTGLHLIIWQILTFSTAFDYLEKDGDKAKNWYNQKTNAKWDLLKNFIALHFRKNLSSNTAFWKHCHNETDLSDIQFYLDFFEKNGPVSQYTESEEYKMLQHDSVYPAFTYDLVQINSHPKGHFLQPGKLTPDVEKTNMLNHFMSKQAVSHLEALEFLQNSDMQFVKNWNGDL